MKYSFFLKLYHGNASVVERMAPSAASALCVKTPLFEYIERVKRSGSPRHVFLTGNAGDGKTFTAMQTFGDNSADRCVVHDASALYVATQDPIETLADHLDRAIQRGQRLFVSINRGQLERLHAYTARRGAEAPLHHLINAAVSELALRRTWPEANPELAVIDLGLLDTLHEDILKPVIERAREVTPDDDMAPAARAALEAAQSAIASEEICARLKATLSSARARGRHVTMRQLWSAVAYLMTGARPPDDDSPLRLEDSVGARLFSDSAEGEVFDAIPRVADPAMYPAALLDLAAITSPDELRQELSRQPGLSFIADPSVSLVGGALSRAVYFHGAENYRVDVQRTTSSPYDKLLNELRRRPSEWLEVDGLAPNLMSSIYKALRLPSSSDSLPAWERLCYDSNRLHAATAVATMKLDPGLVRFALPRPNLNAQEAFGVSWRPPFVWAAYGAAGARLRLSPRLLSDLLGATKDGVALPPGSALHLQRWLSKIGARGSRLPSVVQLFNPEVGGRRLERDWATDTLQEDE